MRRIKVKHFGPIREGLGSDDGFLDIGRVTILIGNQATGKSSLAKLFSTLSWLEKEGVRQLESEKIEITDWDKVGPQFAYQGIEDYFRRDTVIEYIGPYRAIRYSHGRFEITIAPPPEQGFIVPKIMYVPAERNFLSVAESPQKLQGLPRPLYTFLDEYDRSLEELTEALELPINGLRLAKDLFKSPIIEGDGHEVRLSRASSGLQSAAPLYLVTKNIAESLGIEKSRNRVASSLEMEKRRRAALEDLAAKSPLDSPTYKRGERIINSAFRNSCFLNIIEELEQNLYPSSQLNMLYSMIAFANMNADSGLLLTTHSPYLVNGLTLAIKAHALKAKIESTGREALLQDLAAVVPLEAAVPGKEAAVYEFMEDGTIRHLPTYNGLPSDSNILNQWLAEGNAMFDKLLDIEEML